MTVRKDEPPFPSSQVTVPVLGCLINSDDETVIAYMILPLTAALRGVADNQEPDGSTVQVGSFPVKYTVAFLVPPDFS